MFNVPFVKPEHLLQARAMEDALLALPESVVTFVGVVVEPTIDTEPTYYVTIGCASSMDLNNCCLAANFELKKRWKTESISLKAFWGKLRTN